MRTYVSTSVTQVYVRATCTGYAVSGSVCLQAWQIHYYHVPLARHLQKIATASETDDSVQIQVVEVSQSIHRLIQLLPDIESSASSTQHQAMTPSSL